MHGRRALCLRKPSAQWLCARHQRNAARHRASFRTRVSMAVAVPCGGEATGRRPDHAIRTAKIASTCSSATTPEILKAATTALLTTTLPLGGDLVS